MKHAHETNVPRPLVPEFVCEYSSFAHTADGRPYSARVYGIPQGLGVWEAWIVFFPEAHGSLLRTDAETEEASLEDLSVWARAITPAYLERALTRAHPFREASHTHVQSTH